MINNIQDVEIDLEQISSFDDNNSPSIIENDSVNSNDDEHIHQHYIQMFMQDYMNGKRAKKDKEMRQRTRKMFSVLSNVMQRAQSDPLLNILDGNDDDAIHDTNRCRDSDLRTLQNANKLLLSLLELSRELKSQKTDLRKDLKAQKKSRKKAKKTLTSAIDPQVNVILTPSFQKQPCNDSQYLVSTQ